MPVVLELRPQRTYVTVHDVALDHEVGAPEGVEDLLAREDAAGVGREKVWECLLVNCYDCAASAALMAKFVGADSDYYFHAPFGKLNYVDAIGRGKCNNPFCGCHGR